MVLIPHLQLKAHLARENNNNTWLLEGVELVLESSQEGALDASSFLNMLPPGNEQVIEIPGRTVLLKVMEVIGAKQAPIFTCTPCGSSHFKVCVEFDVSSAIFSVGKPPPLAKVEGEICDSPTLAETSAIMNAFRYLGQCHCIQVLDYSSSIIQMFELTDAWDNVKELDHLVKKMIKQWDLSLKQCEKLALELEKEIWENNHGVITEAGQVYAALNDFMLCILKKYRSRPVDAISELEQIQDEHLKGNEKSSKVHHKILKKDYTQTIWFSEMDVLDYVLSYVRMGKAEYKNVLANGGKVGGEARFSFPCMVEGRCCGKLEVRSTSLASSRAQEVAARTALLFMESNFKVKIIDLNYADRQIIEKEHKSLEFMLEKFFEVAQQVKTELSNMVECIAGGCAAYNGDPRLMFGGPLSQEQMMAFEYCSVSLEATWANCARHYESCTSSFQDMEKLGRMLELPVTMRINHTLLLVAPGNM